MLSHMFQRVGIAIISGDLQKLSGMDSRIGSWVFRATAKHQKASVESMDQDMFERLLHPTRSLMKKRFSPAGSIIILFLLFTLRAPMAGAVGLQATSTVTPQGSTAPAVPALNESLRPALVQVGSTLGQIQIDHWKLSREWKGQLRSDANSIQQDLASQLPGLFQAAQQSPAALEPQLGVMHNVDALYDVLVRVATAANLAGGKADAAILDNAVQRLESARKTAAGQLLQAASLRDQELISFQTRIQTAPKTELPANDPAKTIIVNNQITHRASHRKPAPHRKIVPKVDSSPAAASTGGKTGAAASRTTVP